MSGVEEQGVEEPPELVDGELDEPLWCGDVASFGGCGDGEERVGEHGQGGPAVPGGPASDLVLVQSCQGLGGLEGLLDPPPLPGHPNQCLQGDRAGAVAAVVGQLPGGVVAADQHMLDPGVGVVFGFDGEPRPRVPAVALASGACGVALPRLGWDQVGELVDPDRAGSGRHLPVGRDLQHIAQAVSADGLAQCGVGAVDLVTGHPRTRHFRLHGTGDHRRGQRRLGRELRFVRHTGRGAPVTVVGPRLGQIQRPVDQRVPGRCGVGQVDRDLGVLDPPSGAGVLALHPHTVAALLQVAGLVEHKDRIRVAEMVDHIAAQIVTDRVGVPLRPRQQMLQPMRALLATVLGDRPAVLAVQPRHHALDQPGGMPQRLVAGEPRRDQIDHLGERSLPPINRYAVCRGHRRGVFCPHKQPMLTRWPHPHPMTRRTDQPSSHATPGAPVTIYDCRTRRER